MNYITLAIAVFVTYVCVYSLLARICQCIEHCASAKSFDNFVKFHQAMNKVLKESDGEFEPEEKEQSDV